MSRNDSWIEDASKSEGSIVMVEIGLNRLYRKIADLLLLMDYCFKLLLFFLGPKAAFFLLSSSG